MNHGDPDLAACLPVSMPPNRRLPAVDQSALLVAVPAHRPAPRNHRHRVLHLRHRRAQTELHASAAHLSFATWADPVGSGNWRVAT